MFVYSGEADIELTANFKSSYPIYYSTEGNGNLSVVSDSDSKEIASGETLPDGATLIINTVADEHHELTALNLNGSETDLSLLPIRINISGRLDIRAVFAPVHYSIVVKQAVHGNLEVYRELDSFGRGSGTPFGSNDRAPYSTTLYIFATPDSEYSLTAVRVNDKVMLPEKGESYIKHTLDSHICIEPVFTATSSIAAERIDSNEIGGGLRFCTDATLALPFLPPKVYTLSGLTEKLSRLHACKNTYGLKTKPAVTRH